MARCATPDVGHPLILNEIVAALYSMEPLVTRVDITTAIASDKACSYGLEANENDG
jgi:hypothetical protein